MNQAWPGVVSSRKKQIEPCLSYYRKKEAMLCCVANTTQRGKNKTKRQKKARCLEKASKQKRERKKDICRQKLNIQKSREFFKNHE